MLWLKIALLLLVSVIQGLAQTCPTIQCTCEQIQGKWTISCNHRRLQAVPTFDVSETVWKSVVLNNNELVVIPADAFRNIKVQEIDLSNNKITNVSHSAFSGQENTLEKVDLRNNALIDVPNQLSDLNKLDKLDLQFNEIVSINKESMSGFPNLKWFSIYGNGLQTIADDTFAVTPHLEDVNFGINKLGSVPTVALQLLTKLKRLILWANKINQIGVDDLQIPITGLEVLNLGNNPFQSLPAEFFSAFKGLRYFDCSLGQLTQLPDTIFDGLDRLYGLMLQRNSLTSIPTGIKRLEGLQTLDLSNNNITEMKGDEFPEREFNSLQIGSNPLSWLPQKIYHHPYLSSLQVQNISMTGVGYICDALNQKRLRRFYLENNPLHCDCEILWLRQNKEISRYPDQLKCASPPPLAGRNISQVDESEFNCTMTIEQQCPNKGTVHFTSSIILLFMVFQSLTYYM